MSSPLGGRIAIMGAGAMGTMLGARLTQAGLSVDLVDTNAMHVRALNERGATVGGTVEWNVPVRALKPQDMQGRYDSVFLLTKQTHNRDALRQLEPHIHRRTPVCTLQNGVPEPAVAAVLGAERTLGAAVTWAATFLGPGRVESTCPPDNWRCLLGAADGAAGALAEIRSVLSIMCACEIVPDLASMRWSKLLINAAFSGTSAALGLTVGELMEDGKGFICAQYVARECLRVAEALGVTFAAIWPGIDFAKDLDFLSEPQRLATVDSYVELSRPACEVKASILQDLEAGRKTEIDFINGLVCSEGRRMNVPTPVCDTVVRVVKSIERCERPLGPVNLELFSLPES